MPITHSAYKQLRQAKKRSKRNSARLSRIDRARRELKKLTQQKSASGIVEKFRSFASLVDRAVQKGILKKNNAARIKSRVAKLVAPFGS